MQPERAPHHRVRSTKFLMAAARHKNLIRYMGHISLDLFKRVVDEAAGNIEAVTLASRGEPLLHKNIAEMLEYCRGKFLGLKLNTNASVMTEALAHTLLSSDLQTLVISADAVDAELYEKIRVNGKYNTLMKNLEMLQNLRETHYRGNGMTLRVSGVKINDSQDVDKMAEQWRKYVDAVSLTYFNPWQDAYNNPVNDVEAPCTDIWRRTFVWWDGTVNPCDFDYKSTLSQWRLTLSDSPSLSEIWQSPTYQSLRQQHLEGRRGEMEPCRRCIVV